jgi:hypothetical protein
MTLLEIKLTDWDVKGVGADNTLKTASKLGGYMGYLSDILY